MSAALKGISSMATRAVLVELVDVYTAKTGRTVAIESVGGVDAAKRVRAGEAFDVVLLADDALARLEADGLLVAGSRVGFTLSALTAATRAGAPRLAFADEAAMREALLSARTVGYSTGPSGTYLLGLLKRWGIDEAMSGRMVQAPPGVPVGKLVADGQVELGFQQYSEMMNVPGIAVLGPMPPGCGIVSVFSAGLCAASTQPEAVRALIEFMHSPDAVEAKRRHGMEPA